MNGAEQKARQTAVKRECARLAEAWDEELQQRDVNLANMLHSYDGSLKQMQERIDEVRHLNERAVNAERAHRLELAEQQRAYVDAADKRMVGLHISFIRKTFWARLRWLLTGKV